MKIKKDIFLTIVITAVILTALAYPSYAKTTPEGYTVLGRGNTCAYYIDNDADGYGVGKRISGDYSGAGVGDMPDADDNDPEVNTPESMIAKYGTLENFLHTAKGYNTPRIFYISPDGNDAAGEVNNINKPYQHFGALASIYHDGQGGVIIYREGFYTEPMPGGGWGGFPCYQPTASSSASPLIVMAYPGETVELYGTGPLSTNITYWPGKDIGNLVLDGLIFKSDAPGLGYGIRMSETDNLVVRNFEFVDYDDGILVGNHMRNMTVENSVFHDNAYHGFYLGSYGMVSQPGDFNFALDEQNYANGTSVGASKDITLRNNIFYRDGSSGYEPVHINSYATNVIVEGNIIHSSEGTGVGFQSGIYNSVIRNNLIFNNARAGITFSLYGPDNQAATIRNNSIINNIIWTGRDLIGGQTPGEGIVFNDYSDTVAGTHWIKDTTIKNNIIMTYAGGGGNGTSDSPNWGSPAFYFMRDSYPNTAIIKNNLIYYMNPGSSVSDRIMYIAPSAYPTGQDAGNYNFSQFEAYSTNFSGNIYAEPLFTNVPLNFTATPELFDFDYLAASPAINFGLTIDAPLTDLRGNARTGLPDAGCYEYASSVPPAILYGDVSGNGEISAADASLAAQYAVGLISLTPEQVQKADVSGNGEVSAADASLIAQRAVGLIDKFPVEGQ